MNFEEAKGAYDRLVLQLREGKISQDAFQKQVNELRVLDSSGRWWQPDPATGKWLVWNGTSWASGNPPLTGESAKGGTLPAPPKTVKTKTPPNTGKDSSYHFMDLKSFRETRKGTNWKNRPQKWWDLFAVLCGVVIAIIWILYTGLPSSSEGFDFLSPLLMIGLPVVLVLFRGPIDSLLAPIQPFRKKLPPLFLVGISVAVPFLTAIILFDILGITEYSLIHWNLVIGTFLAYAISRDPGPQVQKQTGKNPKMTMVLLFLCMVVVCTSPAFADDCEKDPLNAKDCARTAGIAQLLAAAPAAALGNLLNVPDLARRLYSPATLEDAPGYRDLPGSDWEDRNEEEWQKYLEKQREDYREQKDGTWIPKEQDYTWKHDQLCIKRNGIERELEYWRGVHQETVVECKRKGMVLVYDGLMGFVPVVGKVGKELGMDMADKLQDCLQKVRVQNAKIKELEGELADVNNQIAALESSAGK